jgi:hypothetical protein
VDDYHGNSTDAFGRSTISTDAKSLQRSEFRQSTAGAYITVALRQLRAPTLSSRQSGGYTEECCAAGAERGGKASEEKTTRPVTQCVILLLAVCVSTVAIAGRIHLTCITNKVIIIDTPTGSSSSNSKENLNSWIDEASKKVSFADGVPLSIQRFDDRWISVTGGGVSYELDRESRSLSFAATIMREVPRRS